MLALRKRHPVPYRGLGMTVHGVELEDCTGLQGGGYTLDLAYQCAQRNQARIDASYEQAPGSYLTTVGGTPVYAGTAQAAQIYGPQTSAVTTSPATPPAPTYNPVVSFVASRGGTVLYPGDTWTVKITGAKPGSDIVVIGGRNGATPSTKMGTADSAGNFTLSGAISDAEVGSWQETWTAGGQNAGSFSFTVVAQKPSAPSGSGTSNAGVTPPLQRTVNTTVTQVGLMDWFSESMIGGIPNWVLLAGAGVAIYSFSGRRR